MRNRWQQMSPECQRLYWLATFKFGDEGDRAQQQAKRAAIGLELPFDEEKDKSKLSKLPRGAEPRFAAVFMKWAKGKNSAI